MKKLHVLLAAILGLSCFAISCNDDEGNPTPDQGNVLVVHASPDAPGVDLLVDDNKVNSSALTFPQNTGYLALNAGAHNFKVNVTGTSTTVINADATIEKNKYYSVFAIDSVSQISPLLTVDDLSAPASGKAHIRFIHLSPNAPAVDISVAGQAAGEGIFTNRTFNKTITSGEMAFTPVDAGTYHIEVRVAGTTTVALDLPSVTFASGKIYTIFAKGFLGGSGSQALGAEVIVNK